MALKMYQDDAMTVGLKPENVFTALTAVHTLEGLIALDVQAVYKYTGLAYQLLTSPTDYTIVGTAFTLATALTLGQHVVVLPTAHMAITFTGTEGSSRSQYRKVIFHKDDTTTVYDKLNLYSEDLLVAPIEIEEAIVGLWTFTVDNSSIAVYDTGTGQPLLGTGFSVATDLSTYALANCALVVNGNYICDILGADTSTIVVPLGTVVPTNGVEDLIQIYSTGVLAFALGTAGDTIPAPDAFKRMLTIPTLTSAAPTQYVWMRETVIIPGDTTESVSTPFKLIGQTYAG